MMGNGGRFPGMTITRNRISNQLIQCENAWWSSCTHRRTGTCHSQMKEYHRRRPLQHQREERKIPKKEIPITRHSSLQSHENHCRQISSKRCSSYC
ncbi:hypothetical protein XELAEV_18012251mg [Xenopus laevis]|uniref:Uncharacterized protein n=1 Tax=Xenopus laevis TaxID=8355 RepID=A0A974HXY8_XENLA|nr:hypothetical protein XELAEV_18012251mg [Xenopus laevis]